MNNKGVELLTLILTTTVIIILAYFVLNSTTESPKYCEDRFELLNHYRLHEIGTLTTFYDHETGVVYLTSLDNDAITPLYNSDGTILIYKGE